MITIYQQFVFLLSLVISVSSLAYSSQYIPATSCIFYYQAHNTSANITFNFLNCSLHTGSSISWPDCFTSCCPYMPPDNYSQPQQVTITLCRTNNSANLPTNIIVLVITMIIVLFGVVILTCLCVIVCRICRMLRKASQVRNQAIEIRVVEWNEEKEVNDRLEQELKWSTLATKDNMLKETDEPCSICLDDHTTAELYCKHQYHPHCIGSWLAKNTCCPCCRRDNILGIKVYCSSCRWRYMVCSRNLLMNGSREVPEQCENCRKQRLKSGEESGLQKLQSGNFLFDFDHENEQDSRVPANTSNAHMMTVEDETFN